MKHANILFVRCSGYKINQCLTLHLQVVLGDQQRIDLLTVKFKTD